MTLGPVLETINWTCQNWSNAFFLIIHFIWRFFAMLYLPCEDIGEYMSFCKKIWGNLRVEKRYLLRHRLRLPLSTRVSLSFYNLAALTSKVEKRKGFFFSVFACFVALKRYRTPPKSPRRSESNRRGNTLLLSYPDVTENLK